MFCVKKNKKTETASQCLSQGDIFKLLLLEKKERKETSKNFNFHLKEPEKKGRPFSLLHAGDSIVFDIFA